MNHSQSQPPFWYPAEFFRQGRRDLRRTANPIGFLLLFVALSFTFLPAAFSSLLALIGYRGSVQYAAYGNIDPVLYYLIQGCQFALSLAAPAFLYVALYRPPVERIVPCRRTPAPLFLSLLCLGLGLSLFANLPSQWMVDRFSAFFSGDVGGQTGAAAISLPVLVLMLLRHCVFPAFFEEFLFRGIVLGQLRRFGEGFAIFTSALLFGMFHGNLQQIPFAFLVGLVLGYLLVRTNNLWLTAGVHFLNNVVATLPELLGFFLSDDQLNLVQAIVFAGVFVLAAAALLYLFFFHRALLLPRFPWHPLPLGMRLAAFFSSIGILLLLLMNIGETIWRAA